jgi:hypothetical protein
MCNQHRRSFLNDSAKSIAGLALAAMVTRANLVQSLLNHNDFITVRQETKMF